MALTPEQREYQREWKRKKRAEDPGSYAKELEANRRYRASNPEKAAERNERHREYWKTYQESNRDKISAKSRERYAKNGEKIRERARENHRRNRAANNARQRVSQLRRNHGLLPDTWALMWAAQDGRCYLCGGQLGDRAVIDHDHSHCPAGQSCPTCRRGLAHDECNVAIGLIKDDPDRLRRMADALEMAKQGVTQRIALTGEQLCLYEEVI